MWLGLGIESSIGTDGRIVAYPSGFESQIGTDGRIVAFPPEWATEIGANGRMTAYPSDWKTDIGADGQITPSPPHVDRRMGTDGRIVFDLSKWNEYGNLPYLLEGKNVNQDLFIFVFVNSDHRLLLLMFDNFEDLYSYAQFLASQTD